MNKQSIRAFSSGLITATTVLGSIYFITPSSEQSMNKPDDHVMSETEELKAEIKLLKDQVKEQSLIIQEYEFSESVNNEDNTITNEHEPQSEPIRIYHLQVDTGMTSSEISSILEEAKIITSGKELQQYFMDQQLSRQIQVGKFEVNSNMTIENIVSLLTGNTIFE
ncbi:hypothetical protein [Cytobacillus sp. IB215665]|uniref:hypothetical protein n=1 Tax=Cytobacillus sp. IB215665 TaxID=3097357 RepID=UPI002A0F353C|nr:hypothetical protein [Cytobacillus sp. IB215665]MDX8364228.1 hypothetical protein [Cytobacillus sp. IB215665]